MRITMAVSLEPELARAVKSLARRRRWTENRILKEALRHYVRSIKTTREAQEERDSADSSRQET